jgi:CrcB protein
MNWVSVGFFGAIGVLARFFFSYRFGPSFDLPVVTFLINVSGAYLIGVLTELAKIQLISPEVKVGLAVGFLGGFTTFSSFCLESVVLLQRAQYLTSLLYLLGSPLVGFLSVLLGIFSVRSVFGLR